MSHFHKILLTFAITIAAPVTAQVDDDCPEAKAKNAKDKSLPGHFRFSCNRQEHRVGALDPLSDEELDRKLRSATPHCFMQLTIAIGQHHRHGAEPALLDALTAPDFHRATYAAYALGELREQSARNLLKQVAKTHWYPGARVAAVSALAKLDQPETKPIAAESRYAFEARIGNPRAYCDSQNLFWTPGEIWHANEFGEVAPVITDSRWCRPIVDAWGGPNGELLGTYAGEWGGGLYWIDNHKNVTQLADENVRWIVEQRTEVLMIGGIAHLSMDRGAVYRVRFGVGPVPVAEKILELPSTPRSLYHGPAAQLVVTTRDRAAYDISEPATPRFLGCVDDPP